MTDYRETTGKRTGGMQTGSFHGFIDETIEEGQEALDDTADTVQEGVDNTVDTVDDTISNTQESGGAYSAVGDAYNDLAEGTTDVAEGTADFVGGTGTGEDIASGVEDAFGGIQSGVEDTLSGVESGIDDTFSGVENTFENTSNAIDDTFGDIGNATGDLGSNVGDAFGDATGLAGDAFSGATDIVGDAGDTFGDLTGGAIDTVTDLGDGAVSSITNFGGAGVDLGGDLIDGATDLGGDILGGAGDLAGGGLDAISGGVDFGTDVLGGGLDGAADLGEGVVDLVTGPGGSNGGDGGGTGGGDGADSQKNWGEPVQVEQIGRCVIQKQESNNGDERFLTITANGNNEEVALRSDGSMVLLSEVSATSDLPFHSTLQTARQACENAELAEEWGPLEEFETHNGGLILVQQSSDGDERYFALTTDGEGNNAAVATDGSLVTITSDTETSELPSYPDPESARQALNNSGTTGRQWGELQKVEQVGQCVIMGQQSSDDNQRFFTLTESDGGELVAMANDGTGVAVGSVDNAQELPHYPTLEDARAACPSTNEEPSQGGDKTPTDDSTSGDGPTSGNTEERNKQVTPDPDGEPPETDGRLPEGGSSGGGSGRPEVPDHLGEQGIMDMTVAGIPLPLLGGGAVAALGAVSVLTGGDDTNSMRTNGRRRGRNQNQNSGSDTKTANKNNVNRRNNDNGSNGPSTNNNRRGRSNNGGN